MLVGLVLYWCYNSDRTSIMNVKTNVANVGFVVSVIVDVVLYPTVVLHRAPVPAFG